MLGRAWFRAMDPVVYGAVADPRFAMNDGRFGRIKGCTIRFLA
jgi:hypothetical protein